MPKCSKSGCGKETTAPALKSWMLGDKTKVERFQCPDGHQFNVYTNVKPKEAAPAGKPKK